MPYETLTYQMALLFMGLDRCAWAGEGWVGEDQARYGQASESEAGRGEASRGEASRGEASRGEASRGEARDARARVDRVVERLVAVEDLQPRERAEVAGPVVTAWTERELGDGSSRALGRALDWFAELEHEGESFTWNQVVVADARCQLGKVRRAMIDAGLPRALVEGTSLAEVCALLRMAPSAGEMAERAVVYLALCSPETSEVLEEVLLGDPAKGIDPLPRSKFDAMRRLLPTSLEPDEARQRVRELAAMSVAELRNAARVLAGTRESGELEHETPYVPPDDDPRTRVSGGAEIGEDDARELLDLASGSGRLSFRTSPELLARTLAAIHRRVQESAVPGTDGSRPLGAYDHRDAFVAILADLLTVNHPRRTRKLPVRLREGLEVGGREAVVRTICPCCQLADPLPVEQLLEPMRRSGRLKEGQTPDLVFRLVLMRSNMICEVPGCTRPVDEGHHIRPRRHGIDHDPGNIVGVCRFHHARCIELADDNPRKITVTGTAPHDLTWTLPGGKIVRTREQPPTGWDLAARMRVRGDTAGLFRASVESLAWGEPKPQVEGWRGVASAKLEAEGPARARAAILRDPEVRGLLASTWTAHLGRVGYDAALADLVAPDRDRDHTDVTALGPSRASDLTASHGLSATETSERRVRGAARTEFPQCWRVYATHPCRKGQMLAIARSGLGSEHDELLARLMPHVSLRTMEDVLATLRLDADDPQVRWSIPAGAELTALFQRAALEVRRAHGCSLDREAILAYIIRCDEEGRWREVDGQDFADESALGKNSLAQRVSAPSFASATFECARCEIHWQNGPDGEPVFPHPDRLQDILATAGRPGAPRVRLLPAALDERWDEVLQQQPLPVDELAAIERDGGCVVPGCRHGSEGTSRGLVRACALGGVGQTDQATGSAALTTLCADHHVVAARHIPFDAALGGSRMRQVLRIKGPLDRRPRPRIDVWQLLSAVLAREGQIDVSGVS